jgi:site-specific recombinase XerD
VREGEPILPSLVRSAVRQGYRRAGLPAHFTGTHRLRHTAATRLINAGASIKEVADVLGHTSLDATAIYAKVDLRRLRQVALPWPEVLR